MAGIYIHIPFCKRKCHYCDFYSCTLLAKKEPFLRIAQQELAQRIAFLPTPKISTLYIGGGTPSLCSPTEIGALLQCVHTHYDTAALQEVTVEANPDDLTRAYLIALRQVGVNRLSIGIQSFSDQELQWMHRRHTAAQAIQAVRWAQEAGFQNLTMDLIYGTGRRTLQAWEAEIEQALALQVPHISAYLLSIEPHTLFGRRLRQGTLKESNPEVCTQEYLLLHEKLTQAGYEHYEISNFARPAFRAQHNSNYWRSEPYLGIGPSAHSFNGSDTRQWNVADLSAYLQQTPHNAQFESEHLTDTMRYNEFIMTHLRTSDGVDTTQIEARFGARKLHYFLDQAKKYLASQHIIQRKTVYYIPFESYLISDSIISDLFEA
ncbi:MAG: radical SAM family heme chaperone HemW [Alistipes sp.]|nr:radical SAM family heme chaperone HemW [Alistipes sp.]